MGYDRGVLAQRLKWDVAEIVKKQAEVGIHIICRSCSMTTMAGCRGNDWAAGSCVASSGGQPDRGPVVIKTCAYCDRVPGAVSW